MFTSVKYLASLGTITIAGLSAGVLTFKIPLSNGFSDFENVKSKFLSNTSQKLLFNNTKHTSIQTSLTNESTNNTTNVKLESKNRTDSKPSGWIIVQKDKSFNTEQPISYTISTIKKNFQEKGFDIKVVNSLNIDVYLTNLDRKSILIDDVVTPKPDFVLSRTGANTNFRTLAVYRHLERLGVPVINGSDSIIAAKDKLYSLQILAENNIPVPRTILLTFPVNVKYVVKRLGLPIIIKCLSGMQGKGVFIARDEHELQTYCDLLETLQPKNPSFIFQECMQHSLGKDIRVLVVNGEVVGAMLRDNTESDDFRANIHRGAKGSAFKLPRRARNIARQAARVLNLDIAGVDLLFDDEKGKKFRVCEVNSSPGLEGFENATNINVSKHFIHMIRSKCGLNPFNNDDDDDFE